MLSEDIPAQLTEFRAGSLLAGYRLERQVGRGGFAVVFRALDERLGRPVALKILSPALASSSPEFRRRFIAESRAAAAVDDPHIIPVYEAGEADGVLFIAMRYVAGGDLRDVLEREGALSPDRAADFVSPVASALDAAHGAGLVHRDVKPGNILVDAGPGRPDHVYLSDFGIVKGALSVNLTGVGGYIGTPDYMAPEQISGRAVDGRTDQYSLACVAFQLLTGAVPFERDSLPAVIYAQLSTPPPSLVSQRSDLPAAADAVVAKAMAKTPEKRYESCGDFADALREALGLASYHRRGPATYPPPGSDETPEVVVADHPHATAGQDPRLPPRTATVVTAAGPEAAVANGRSTEGLQTTGPTPAPPSRRPRWPLRRNRPAASMPPSTAATARDVDVRDLPTSGQSRPAVPGGAVAPTAAAAVAEDQRTGDRGTIVPSAEPDPADVIAPVEADGRGGTTSPAAPVVAGDDLPLTAATTPAAPVVAGGDLPAVAATTPAIRQPAGDLGPAESADELPWLRVPGSGGDGTGPAQPTPRRRGPVAAWFRRYRLPVFALACAAVAAAATLPFISANHATSSRPGASTSPSVSPHPAIGFGWLSLGNLSDVPSPVDVYLYAAGRSSPQFVRDGVAYGSILPYHAVDAGDYTVKVRHAGATASSSPVWSVALTVHAGSAYTVAPIRTTAQQGQLKVIDNDLTAPKGKSLVRVIQADINQGQVTFHCSCAAGAPGNITMDAAPGSVSAPAPIPTGIWTMSATGPSAKTSLPVALTDGTVHNEIVVSKPGGGIEIINLVQAPPSYQRVVVPLNGSGVPITSVAFSPSGATLAIGSAPVCLWNIAAARCTSSLAGVNAYSLAFSPDGKTLAVTDGISSSRTYLWHIASSQTSPPLTGPALGGAYSVALTSNGRTLAVGYDNGQTYLWDVAARKPIFTFTDPGGKGVNSVAFTHDGKILAAGDANGHTYLWDVATGKPIFALPGPGSKGVVSVACSPDNTTMAAAGNNGSIYIWNVDNGKLLATLADPNKTVINSVAFSPDGQVLAASDNNSGVFLWYKS